MTNYYKKLRQQLPYSYSALISRRLPGVTPRQVRAVFGGRITDSEIVDPVIKVALKIRAEEERRIQHIKKAIKSKRTNGCDLLSNFHVDSVIETQINKGNRTFRL